MPLRRRVLWSLVAFLVSLILIAGRFTLMPGAGSNDFSFPMCGATALIQGENPYSVCLTNYGTNRNPQNPLTTILVALPFAMVHEGVGALLLWSTITAMLVYGILTMGKPWQLLIFTSGAYWRAWYLLQWSPLMAAIMFLPDLLPLAMVKPQIGIPVAVSRLSKRRACACFCFGLLSLVVMPTWPWAWWQQASNTYDGLSMVTLLPFGPLLLLSLLRWREPRARFLLMMSALPVRGVYDLTALWTLPETPKQMLTLSLASWIAVAATRIKSVSYYPPFALIVYIPLLAIILTSSSPPAVNSTAVSE